MQETPVPPYPFCHIGVDVSGPYPTTLSGNKYIIGFIDLYSGWPEAFSVPAKTTDNVAHLLIEEIIPRHSGIQILTSDNTVVYPIRNGHFKMADCKSSKK